jgi:hypothetical protein
VLNTEGGGSAARARRAEPPRGAAAAARAAASATRSEALFAPRSARALAEGARALRLRHVRVGCIRGEARGERAARAHRQRGNRGARQTGC